MKVYPNRFEMMKDLVKPGATLCEIGVFTGEFANQLLRLQPKRLFLIDPFQGVVSSGDADGNNVKEAALPLVYVQLAQQVARVPSITLLRGFSHELLPMFPEGCFDAIYIDGDHSYEGVKRDLGLAWKLVREGGYVCGHDYETNLEKTKNKYDFGVKRAVDEFCRAKDTILSAKAMDGQVSFAIKKESRLNMYIDTSDAKFCYLTAAPPKK
jgi:hypothetical protein